MRYLRGAGNFGTLGFWEKMWYSPKYNVNGLWYGHARSEGKVYTCTWNEHIFVHDILLTVEKFHWSVTRVSCLHVGRCNISVQCVCTVYIVSIVFTCDCSYVKYYRTVQTQTFPSICWERYKTFSFLGATSKKMASQNSVMHSVSHSTGFSTPSTPTTHFDT